MKLKTLIFIPIIAVLALSIAFAGAFKAGDKVQVEWNGSWYAATILEANGDQYLIHYDGYDSSWDETVGPSRIKAASSGDSSSGE